MGPETDWEGHGGDISCLQLITIIAAVGSEVNKLLPILLRAPIPTYLFQLQWHVEKWIHHDYRPTPLFHCIFCFVLVYELKFVY